MNSVPRDTTNSKGRSEDGLKSLTKVVRVLDTFSAVDRALSLAEIGQRTGFPKSTTHRLLASMREAGLLDQDRERDRYRLGMKLFELGNIVLANMDLHREARPFVDALTRQSGQAVHLAVFDGHQALVIHRADASPEKGHATALIEHAPVHCTSVGKAILAFQTQATIERVIATGLVRYTDNTITNPARLREVLAEIRERGYAVDEGEHQPGLRCVGAPVRDQSGRVIAAVSITGPFWRLPQSEVEGLAKVAMHSANAISLALGYRPSDATGQPAMPR
jgi:DNA-binding IclR family transcriptional regulator